MFSKYKGEPGTLLAYCDIIAELSQSRHQIVVLAEPQCAPPDQTERQTQDGSSCGQSVTGRVGLQSPVRPLSYRVESVVF